jgi:predicted ATPase with chaperone activity
VRDFCAVDDAGPGVPWTLLRAATRSEQLQMSARACHRTLSVKLARTIAALAGSDRMETMHLALPTPLSSGVLRKVIQYRPWRQT